MNLWHSFTIQNPQNTKHRCTQKANTQTNTNKVTIKKLFTKCYHVECEYRSWNPPEKTFFQPTNITESLANRTSQPITAKRIPNYAIVFTQHTIVLVAVSNLKLVPRRERTCALRADRLPSDIISRYHRVGGWEGAGARCQGDGWKWQDRVGGGGGAGGCEGREIRGCAVEGFASRFRPEGTISNGTKHESAGTVSGSAIFQLLPPSVWYAPISSNMSRPLDQRVPIFRTAATATL